MALQAGIPAMKKRTYEKPTIQKSPIRLQAATASTVPPTGPISL
jgi:hypothetical protein